MNKNENDYMDKIQYWTGKLNDEVMNTKKPDIDVIASIHRKLDYFIGKQVSGEYHISEFKYHVRDYEYKDGLNKRKKVW